MIRSRSLALLLGMACGLMASLAPTLQASTTGGDEGTSISTPQAFLPTTEAGPGFIIHAGGTPGDYTAMYNAKDAPSATNFIPGTLSVDPGIKPAENFGRGVLLILGLFGAALVALLSVMAAKERIRERRERDISYRDDDGPALMRACLMRS